MKKILATILATALGLGAWAVDPVTIKDADGADISVYEVSSGFYQNGDTYDSTTDFYITSKDGLKYFRDWVNGTSAAMNHYYDSGFLTLSLASFASNNGMAGKNVHLLADIDLTGEVWQPIGPNSGSVPDKFDNYWKAHFYGSFYGHNHVVSNMDTSASDQGDKYSRWPQGFFGSIASGGPIDGLILENVKAISNFTGGYAGAIVGNLGSNPYTISNCKVRGKIEISGGYSGAICGIGNANVVNCEVSGDDGSTISGVYFAGALVGAERCGSAGATITDNNVSGVAVTSSQFAGGLVGAMASGASGTCDISENTLLPDVTVNGNVVTIDSLIDSNSGATTTQTTVDNTIVAPQSVKFSVPSTNMFGAVKITGNVASNLYVALPFEGFEADGALRKAQDLVHPANLTAGSKLFAYDKANDRYNVYEADDGKWTTPTKVTVTAEGKTVVDTADLGYGVASGTGAILERKNTAETVYVYGQVPMALAESVTFGAGQTLVSPPYTNATVEVGGASYVDLNSFDWTGVAAAGKRRLKGLAAADYIQFRTADNRLVKYYYLDDGKWGVVPAQVALCGALVADGRALVPVGTAFWYYSVSGGAKVKWRGE